MPSPGGRPDRAVNVWTSGRTDSRIAAATARPSRRRAVISPPGYRGLARGRLEVPEILRLAEHDEKIPDTHDAFGRRVEFHRAARALDADHHDAELLPEVGLDDRAAGKGRVLANLHLLHVEIQVVGTGSQLHEIHDRGTKRRLCE